MNNELVLKNEKLIYFVLKKMGVYHKKEEFYDLGMIGLCKAANTFNKENKTNFSTYATACIANEIKQELRRNERLKDKANFGAISLESKVKGSYEKELEIKDLIKDDTDLEKNAIKEETIKEMVKALEKLDQKEKEMIVLFFGLGNVEKKSQCDLSNKFGISQAQVSRTIKSGINKLRISIKITR